VFDEPIPPGHTLESVRPPKLWAEPGAEDVDPMSYVRKPVTEAHAIDVKFGLSPSSGLSKRDTVKLARDGSVTHGIYGKLDPDLSAAIPLEYLSLLRQAAEGAAALRSLGIEGGNERRRGKGTLLIYGATRPSALASLQLASTSGYATVAIVDGQHSGSERTMEILKHSFASELCAMVPEEYAVVRSSLRDLVNDTVCGDNPMQWYDNDTKNDSSKILSEFQENVIAYRDRYPGGEKIAATEHDRSINSIKMKDRKNFDINKNAYLSQYPASPPNDLNAKDLQSNLDPKRYQKFRSEFHRQTTNVISGGGSTDFRPATLLRDMTSYPVEDVTGSVTDDTLPSIGDRHVPYEFSILSNELGNGLEVHRGGPLVGALIELTDDLNSAIEVVEDARAKAKSGEKRAIAEALQFLTESQRNAYAAAMGVINVANNAGVEVLALGGKIPGLRSIEATDEDVQEALSAMDIGEDGKSRLNYLVQVYRAGDYPVYAEYAVHRATETLAGPRQIVVTV